MRKVRKIEPQMPVIKAKKKVAAYARVSMETERLMHSLSAQISYYSSKIQKNPDWTYVGVYADEGITGTSAEKRSEFQRMLADCEAGKIDIILTKSISRFARNTVDLLETVRHLKDLGIGVRFEEQNIDTLSGDGELMLTILASFAQEESRSISENLKWSIRKRFKAGIPVNKSKMLGYRWEGDTLVVVPEEAAIVKRIFQNFLDGKSRLETERELDAEGLRSVNGCKMNDSQIRVILSNITYTGNMLLQKDFIEDPITKKRRHNHGELPRYFIEDTHEAIIDMETFQYVQDEMERRRQLGALANKSLNITCFTGKIKCPYCNLSYMHDGRTRNGWQQDYWVCGSRKRRKVGDGCPVGGTISTKSLKKACAEVLGVPEFDDEIFLDRVAHIEVPKRYTLILYMKDGAVIEKDCPNTGHQDCWTAEYRAETSRKRRKKPTCKASSVLTGKIKCSVCGCNFRRQGESTPSKDREKRYHWRCAQHGADCHAIGLRDDLLRQFIAEIMGMEEFDEKAFAERIEYISVSGGSDLEFHYEDGRVQVAHFQKPKREGHKWTDEQRAKFQESIKDSFTPERRQQISETVKRIRAERYWCSTGRSRNGKESHNDSCDNQ